MYLRLMSEQSPTVNNIPPDALSTETDSLLQLDEHTSHTDKAQWRHVHNSTLMMIAYHPKCIRQKSVFATEKSQHDCNEEEVYALSMMREVRILN